MQILNVASLDSLPLLGSPDKNRSADADHMSILELHQPHRGLFVAWGNEAIDMCALKSLRCLAKGSCFKFPRDC